MSQAPHRMEQPPPWAYDLEIEEIDGTTHTVQLGDEPGWLERYQPILETTAKRMSLRPKVDAYGRGAGPLPQITINLNPDRKWILFSRVEATMSNSQAGGPPPRRKYAIGYETGAGEAKRTVLFWIDHHTGSIIDQQ
jgi:hypothetical protein